MEIKSVHTPRVSSPSKVRRISTSGNEDFVVENKGGTAANIEMLQGAAVSTMDTLCLLLDKQKSPYQKEIALGNFLLDELDDLRMGLLNGTISKDSLCNLSNITNKNLHYIEDINLNNLLKEIRTRAKVELAKIEKNNRFQKSSQ